jgi:outer membrane lipoprotein-sorting protein
MPSLEDIVILLRGARNRVTTLSAELRDWQDSLLFSQTLRHVIEETDRSVGFLEHNDPEHRFWERRTRVHWAAPNRFRMKSTSTPTAGHPDTTDVSNGIWRWQYVAGQTEALRSPVHRGGIETELERLLNPAWLAAVFDLTLLGSTEHDGRRAWRVNGRVREGQRSLEARVGTYGINAIVDGERGILLSLTYLAHTSQPFQRHELVNLILDQLIDRSVFEFTPPSGVPISDIE